jgi:integrase
MPVGATVSPSRASSALVPLPHDGGDVALPDELLSRAKDYAKEALAARTRKAYAYWWRTFSGWCRSHRRQALPASPETVAAWLTAPADGAGTGRPLARSSINQALAAVTKAHRAGGHVFDRKHPAIAMTWAGISRTKALVGVERRAAPIVAADVCELLDTIDTARALGCRNAALLLVGWGAALRRSELVALDWEQLGAGMGFARLDERGILIVLARSKASQDKAETVVIPRADLPEACDALEAWAQRAGLQPGEAIFRAVDNRHRISGERLRGDSVARIVKKAMRDLARARCKTKVEAREMVRRYSGHSLRSGFVTAAAAIDVPALKIARHTLPGGIVLDFRKARRARLFGIPWLRIGLRLLADAVVQRRRMRASGDGSSTPPGDGGTPPLLR